MPLPNQRSFAHPAPRSGRAVRPESVALRLPCAEWLEGVDVTTAIAHLPCARWFLSMLVASELLDDLRTPGPWTVLVPNDTAIARWPSGALDRLFDPDEVEALIDLGEHHVARGGISRAPREPISIATLGGAERRVALLEGGSSGEVTAALASLRCRNGHVLLIDEVLAPPWLDERFFGKRLSRGRDAA
jgi:uncharacterized surface protein with fasciclin (FAS1) repeats